MSIAIKSDYLSPPIKLKGMIVVFCVFNERLIQHGNASHIRQLKEDKYGRRYPMAKDGRAIIRSENGIYTGIINGNEIIAVSSDIQTVYERLKHADKDIEITIRKGRRRFTQLQNYLNTYLPRIYRITYSDTKDHGLIIAADDYKAGDYSTIRLFYDFDKLIAAILRKQGNDDNYYIYAPRFFNSEIREKLGGIKAFDVPKNLATVGHLRQAIEDRQKAGSHSAYYRGQKREITLMRFGRTGDEYLKDDIEEIEYND